MTPRIAGVATAVPSHALPQAEARAFARGFFAEDFADIDRLLDAFDHTGIETRQLARPIAWYGVRRTFPEKNAVYREAALALGEEAARRALDRAVVEPAAVGALVFVSTTGLATPSLDSHLILRLGLPASAAAGGAAVGAGDGVGAGVLGYSSQQSPLLLFRVPLRRQPGVRRPYRTGAACAEGPRRHARQSLPAAGGPRPSRPRGRGGRG